MQRISTYIHEHESWSNFTWRIDQLIMPLGEVHFLQGRILGKMEALGFSLQKEAFLETLIKALKSTDTLLKRVWLKGEFWQKNSLLPLNDRQKRMLNKILDGVDGHFTSDKWAKLCKCSKDTAIRDLNDLLSKNILQKDEAGGRSTRYRLS